VIPARAFEEIISLEQEANLVSFDYVKYFDIDTATAIPFRDCRLIPNLEGNRLTNDVKTAMKKGEEETFQLSLPLSLSFDGGKFLLMRVSF
jgi:hypothetical protein